MQVECTADCREAINTTTTKTYPKGWIGSVDDALGNAWVAAGTARKLTDTPTLTGEETAVLKAVAQHGLAVAAAQGQADGAAMPDVAAEIRALSLADLRAMAKANGVATARRKREEIEADLVAKAQSA